MLGLGKGRLSEPIRATVPKRMIELNMQIPFVLSQFPQSRGGKEEDKALTEASNRENSRRIFDCG